MRILSIALISYLIMGIQPVQGQGNWKLLLSRNEIRVYRKLPPRKGIYEFRAKGTLLASVPRVMSLIQNVYFMKDWVRGVDTSKLLYRNFNHESYHIPLEKMYTLMYARIKMRWPLKDRDFVLKATASKIPDGVVIHLRPGYFPRVPKHPNTIRMKDIKITVILKQLGPKKTLIDYRIYANPGGMIPAFLVNLLIPSESYETIRGLRKLLATTRRFPKMEALIEHHLTLNSR